MLSDAALLAALTVEHGAGAADCLEAKKLERAVERRLKRRVFVGPADAQLLVRVAFSRVGDTHEAKIELGDPDGASRGTRVLQAAGHCSKLDDSLALSVALLVDEPPDLEPVPAAPDLAAEPTLPSPPAAARPRTLEIPPEVAAPREPWQVRLGLAAKGTWGVVPGLRPALSLQLGVVPRGFWPILLQADGYLAARAERNAQSGARFELLRAGLAVCPVLTQPGALEIGVCVGQQLGWVSVEGYGFDRNAAERRLSYALAAGGEGRLRLFGPVSGRAYLGAEVPLLRDRFASGGGNAVQLFQQSPLGFSGEMGLEATLW